MNKVILTGRLVKDAELRFTQSGAGVASFTLAVDGWNSKEKKKEATFVNCVAWNRGENKLAERISEYLGKGSQCLVEGKLQVRNYEAKDGTGKRYITEVVADVVEFIGAKKEQSNKTEQNKVGDLDLGDFGEVLPF